MPKYVRRPILRNRTRNLRAELVGLDLHIYITEENKKAHQLVS